MEASPIAVTTVYQTDFWAGEFKSSFRFQTRHIMRDMHSDKEDNKLEKQASRLFQISRWETMTFWTEEVTIGKERI